MKLKEDGVVFYVVGDRKSFTGFNREIGRHLENVTVKHLTSGKQLRGRTPSRLKRFVVLDKGSSLITLLEKKYSKQFINVDLLTEKVERETRNHNIFERYLRKIPKVQPVESGK